MYKQQYNTGAMDKLESQRLYEVTFYLLVMRMLKTFEPFNLVIDFILSIGTFFKCNSTILHRVVLRILDNNMMYKPHVGEAIILFHKARIPIRDICELLDISNFTVYKYIKAHASNPIAITTRHDHVEYDELYKFMIGFNKLKGIL
jgi:hypothetical protein